MLPGAPKTQKATQPINGVDMTIEVHMSELTRDRGAVAVTAMDLAPLYAQARKAGAADIDFDLDGAVAGMAANMGGTVVSTAPRTVDGRSAMVATIDHPEDITMNALVFDTSGDSTTAVIVMVMSRDDGADLFQRVVDTVDVSDNAAAA
jgi:hypothetical protein